MNNKDIVAAKNISATSLSTTGDITTAATQKLETGYLKLLSEVNEDLACDPKLINALSQSQSDPNKLLRCNGSTKTWVSILQKGDPGIQGNVGPIGPANTKGTVSFYDSYWVYSPAGGNRFNSPIPCNQRDKYMVMLEQIEYTWEKDSARATVWCLNGQTLTFVLTANGQAGAQWNIYKIN
jgi:hypothetical protein